MRILWLLLTAAFAAEAQNALYLDIEGGWKRGSGDRPDYARPDFDDSAWRTVPNPYIPRRGADVTWLRRAVDLPPGTDRSQLVLTLGSVSDFYEVYVNGAAIGGTGFDPDKWQISRPRSFPIPPDAVKEASRLLIAIKTAPLNRGFPLQWTRYSEGPYVLTYGLNAPASLGRMSIDLRRLKMAPGFVFAVLYLLLGLLVPLTRGQNPAPELWLSAFLFAAGGREILYDWSISESGFLSSWSNELSRAMTLAIAAAYTGFVTAVAGFGRRWIPMALVVVWAGCCLATHLTQDYASNQQYVRVFFAAGTALSAVGLVRLGKPSLTPPWLLRATTTLVGLAWFNGNVSGLLFSAICTWDRS